MAEKFYDFDPAEVLTNDETIAIYLTEARKIGDTKFIATALETVARAKGITQKA